MIKLLISKIRDYVDKSIISHNSILICCVFHNDNNPSLSINTNGYYYCFGCKKKGSVFEIFKKLFLTQAQIKDIVIEGFAKKFKQNIKKTSINKIKYMIEDEDFLGDIFKIFRENLLERIHDKILLEFLQTRKFTTTDIINNSDIGYINKNHISTFPEHHHNKLMFYFKIDKNKQIMINSSLVFLTKNIENTSIINFSIRNIYQKKFLFLKNKPKGYFIINFSNKTDEVYFVEGVFDGLRLYKRFRLKNIIIINGSSFNEQDIYKIVTLYKKIYLFFDNDEAGKNITFNIIMDFLKYKNNIIHNIKIGKLECKDPDEEFKDEKKFFLECSSVKDFLKKYTYATLSKNINLLNNLFEKYYILLDLNTVNEIIKTVNFLTLEQLFYIKYSLLFSVLKEQNSLIQKNYLTLYERFKSFYQFCSEYKIYFNKKNLYKVNKLSKYYNLTEYISDIKFKNNNDKIYIQVLNNLFTELQMLIIRNPKKKHES